MDIKIDMSKQSEDSALASQVAAKTFSPLKISSRQIALLNALGEFRNLRRAAAAMHTTQPAASLLLQQLEERLDAKLFERLPRGMEPTLYGDVMIRYAHGAIHEFEHAEAQLAELARGLRAWCASAP